MVEGLGAVDHDSKRIVREWNREIEVEDRRLAAARQDGWGKIVAWTVLELMWLVVVFAVLALNICTNAGHASPNVAAIGTIYCQGYIDGVHDDLNQTRRDNGLNPCPSEGYSADKAISAVTRFLTAYPTYAEFNGAAVVRLAIKSAWKCI
jgi:Rap1a immunity proteins